LPTRIVVHGSVNKSKLQLQFFDIFSWSTSPTSCLKDITEAEDVLFS